jgi:3-oxoadipate enol-lactonase
VGSWVREFGGSRFVGSGFVGSWFVMVVLVALLSSQDRQSGQTSTGLAYDRQGNGPAVVLITGSNLDRRMWAREAEWLTPHFTVVRYDLRAHGQSALPVPTLTPVADLVALLDHLNIKKASLVGLSAGAGIALDAALDAPDRVERIVVAAPTISGYVPKSIPPFFADLRAALQAKDYPRANEVLIASPLFATPPESQALVRTMVTENNRLWSVTREMMPPPGKPALDRLESIKAPLLVLVGEKDGDAMKEQGDLLARRVPGANLVVVPGGGHLLNLTSPREFQEAVAGFLKP